MCYWSLVGLRYIGISARVSGLAWISVRSVCVACVVPPPRATGRRPGRLRGNGNASLYYKSRPEGTWGSPHDKQTSTLVKPRQPTQPHPFLLTPRSHQPGHSGDTNHVLPWSQMAVSISVVPHRSVQPISRDCCAVTVAAKTCVNEQALPDEPFLFIINSLHTRPFH